MKVGQQSLDQEFIVSSNALLFVNTGFGWPMLPSTDLPGGGPAYPLSALGARVRAQFTPEITGLIGLFNGCPTARFNTGDAQQRNAPGTSFPLNGGALLIGELQYSFPGNGGMVTPDSKGVLPGSTRSASGGIPSRSRTRTSTIPASRSPASRPMERRCRVTATTASTRSWTRPSPAWTNRARAW